jgi:hypothetical protein
LAERRQRFLDIRVRHTDAGILDDHRITAALRCCAAYRDTAASGRELDGVAHQVDHDLADHALHRDQPYAGGRQAGLDAHAKLLAQRGDHAD